MLPHDHLHRLQFSCRLYWCIQHGACGRLCHAFIWMCIAAGCNHWVAYAMTSRQWLMLNNRLRMWDIRYRHLHDMHSIAYICCTTIVSGVEYSSRVTVSGWWCSPEGTSKEEALWCCGKASEICESTALSSPCKRHYLPCYLPAED